MTTWQGILLFLGTSIAAGVAAWGCICRFNFMHSAIVPIYVRLQYGGLFVSTLATILAPWLGAFGPLITAFGLAAFIGFSSRNWRYGVPATLRTDWGDLDTQPAELHHEHLRHVAGGTAPPP